MLLIKAAASGAAAVVCDGVCVCVLWSAGPAAGQECQLHQADSSPDMKQSRGNQHQEQIITF